MFSQEDDETGENNANVDIEADDEDDDEEDLEFVGKINF